MSYQSFTIDGRLPSLNETIAKINHNRYAGAAFKTEWTDYCTLYIKKAKIRPFKKQVVIRIRWVEPNMKRDLDNISGGGCKFLLDGIVKAGVLENDTRKWISTIVHDFSMIDKENPRIEVEMEEII